MIQKNFDFELLRIDCILYTPHLYDTLGMLSTVKFSKLRSHGDAESGAKSQISNFGARNFL